MQPKQQLDTDVVNLAKAIRQVESGGNLHATGASGEFGGYQFTPDTWKAYSQEIGLNVPLEQASREQQNEVVYKKLKQWKDEGNNIGQVASMWNAGSGKPNAYIEGHRGVNEQGVQFDTPAYAERVAKEYQNIKSGGQLGGVYTQPPEAKPFVPATTSGMETLGQQAGIDTNQGFIKDVGGAITGTFGQAGEAMQKGFSGEINPLSSTLQTVGAGIGGVGDVVNATLENTPLIGGIYKGATDVIGGAVQGVLGTEQGQKATEWFGGLSPEAQGNIGAGFNVLSAIPFFHALKYGRAGMGDLATTIRSEDITKKAGEELRASLNQKPSRVLERAESRGLDPMGTIVNNKDYLPDIVENNGRYVYETRQASENLQRSITADELALQNLLRSRTAKTPDEAGLAFNINDVAKQTLDDVLKAVGRTGGYQTVKSAITKYFNSYKKSMNNVEFISLDELNDIKRDIRSTLDFGAIDPTSTLPKEARLLAGHSLMEQVENAAKKAGIKGVEELNKKMSNDINAQDILEFLNNRPVKSGGGDEGLIKSIGKTLPGVEGVIDYASGGIPKTPVRRLKIKQPLAKTGKKFASSLGAGLVLSGQIPVSSTENQQLPQ